MILTVLRVPARSATQATVDRLWFSVSRLTARQRAI
jgi:hypothetical protein